MRVPGDLSWNTPSKSRYWSNLKPAELHRPNAAHPLHCGSKGSISPGKVDALKLPLPSPASSVIASGSSSIKPLVAEGRLSRHCVALAQSGRTDASRQPSCAAQRSSSSRVGRETAAAAPGVTDGIDFADGLVNARTHVAGCRCQRNLLPLMPPGHAFRKTPSTNHTASTPAGKFKA